MRLFGTVRNSKTGAPVQGARIRLSIGDTEIDSIESDEQGRYEFKTEIDYIGRPLNLSIEKDCFISVNIFPKIDRPEVQLEDILLEEYEIEIKGRVLDDKSITPLESASINFKLGGEAKKIVSSKNGSFSISVPQCYPNESIDYEVTKKGYKPKKGKLQLKEGVGIEIRLSKKPPSKKKWIMIGIGILAIAVVIILYLEISKPQLGISTSNIDFGTIKVGDQSKEGNFQIYNYGSRTLQWQFSNTPTWIILNPSYGYNSGTVTVKANTAGLNPGPYEDYIYLNSNGGSQSIKVKMNIEPPPASKLRVSQDALIFGAGEPKSKTFTISNEGSGTLVWSISDYPSWITVTPLNGNNNGNIDVSINTAGLNPGHLTGSFTITSNDINKIISVDVTQYDAFIGSWVNKDPNTIGVDKLEITQTGSELRLHIWVSKNDWGTKSGYIVGNSIKVDFNAGGDFLRKMTFTLTRIDDLVLEVEDVYNDGKSDKWMDYFTKG